MVYHGAETGDASNKNDRSELTATHEPAYKALLQESQQNVKDTSNNSLNNKDAEHRFDNKLKNFDPAKNSLPGLQIVDSVNPEDVAAEGKGGNGMDRPQLFQDVQKEGEQREAAGVKEMVDSILKNGKLPEDMDRLLMDYGAIPFAGFHGDPAGLASFVDKVNAALKQSGSQYHLDLSSQRRTAEPGASSALSSWTEYKVSLRDGKGKESGSSSVTMDYVAKPGVMF